MWSRRDYWSIVLGVGLLLSAGAFASAKDRPYLSADEADVEKLLEDRIRFVRDMYQPSGSDMAKIQESLRDLVNAQQQYQRQAALTLSRLALAISIVHHDPNLIHERKLLRINKFQTQYHNILARAPLSLLHTVRLAEATVPAEQASAGRARMTEKLALNAKELATVFDLDRVDGIVHGPIEPGPRPAIQLPDRQAPQPLVLSPQPAERSAPLQPATPSVQPSAETPAEPAKALPPPPPPAPRSVSPSPGAPVATAPPVSAWKDHLNVATQKYGFNPAQMEAAQSVINQSIGFAMKHIERNQSAIDQANAMPDSPEKTAKLKELNDPVDRTYDSMVRRIDALASIEQRNRAAQNESTAGSK